MCHDIQCKVESPELSQEEQMLCLFVTRSVFASQLLQGTVPTFYYVLLLRPFRILLLIALMVWFR